MKGNSEDFGMRIRYYCGWHSVRWSIVDMVKAEMAIWGGMQEGSGKNPLIWHGTHFWNKIYL